METLKVFEEMGAGYCSNAQLLSVISGAKVEKCQALLGEYPIYSLGNVMTAAFQKHGITRRQMLSIRAASKLEGRMYQPDQSKITCSSESAKFLMPKMFDLEHEEFWVLCLNTANKVIAEKRISIGGITSTVVDCRLVAKAALSVPKCVGVILSHNHPSGALRPTAADIDLTKKIKSGLGVLDIAVLDHIIIGGNGYMSFADEGLI